MIVIVDSGVANLHSILYKCKKLKAEVIVSSKVLDIDTAEKIILPGVGSFDSAISFLEERDLKKTLRKVIINKKIPVLGICLGMQLLTKGSEEGDLEGLGVIDGYCKRFDSDKINLKVPHVGWNSLQIHRENKILENFNSGDSFYFTHSYHVHCNNESDILSTTEYGFPFVSSFHNENIYGTQFHPEKSHRSGMQLIDNFIHHC